jgi:DNA invertase Pin-like site-specific DNA recombinase
MPPPKAAPVAFSYIRFSHPSQAEGDSLRRQTEAAAEWCRANKVALDGGLTLHDLGKSAYTGKHRSNPDRHALAAFLKLVEQGRVPRGSYLVIENLDRLSREHIRPALTLLLNLIDAGVRVVQLKPAATVFDDNVDPYLLMMAIMELSRGHSESAMKSERNGKAWAERKRKARAGGILTRRLPAWIEERGGKLVTIPERAAGVSRIFNLAAAGYGAAGIVRKLTEEGVPPFGASGHWSRTYVVLILTDRRALGELQPRRHPDGKPDGPAIPDYFPAVVDDAEWHAAQGVAARARRATRGRAWTPEEEQLALELPVREAARRLKRSPVAVRVHKCTMARRGQEPPKPPPKRHVNVFAGLLRDPHDGGAFYVATRSSKQYGTRWRVLLNHASAEGRAPARSFPYETFERAVLSRLREVDPREVMGETDGPDETLVLAGELARAEAKIGELEAELMNGDVAALAKVLRQLEVRKRDLAEKLTAARQKAAHPLSESWGRAQSLIGALDAAPDPVDARVRLKSALRRVVESVWVLPVARGRDRVCAVQIHFRGNGHRDYLILHRPHRRTREGAWSVRSFADAAAPGDLDLRDPDHARQLEKVLATLPVEAE